MVMMTLLTLNLSSVYFPAGSDALSRTLDALSTVNRLTVLSIVIVCHPLESPTLAESISIVVDARNMPVMLASYACCVGLTTSRWALAGGKNDATRPTVGRYRRLARD